MSNLTNTFESAFSMLKVVFLFASIISLTYVFIIPTWFPNYKTYSVLIFCCIISSLIAGWIGYRGYMAHSQITRVLMSGIYAVLDVSLILIISLFFIIKFRGS